ncbi:A kinase (PRKA) anchor protein 1b [Electrophorus electricus]|uniref:Tudor domain-containing protein n=1 Tax=Electrophorus electricus TaxID=8005 RepID=A0A4W4FNF7_ELEEL|nr:A kinase (PRKA) anchor protein 1b [Electrophorus electricus]XP_026877273.2 A kinase (PRKA) anchor protein 1b [Electrophorus electricus]
MPLRFRSFVPYTLPGVLMLIGWWWYISRKKGRVAGHNSEEGPAMGLRASPSEGSNGVVEKGCPPAGTAHTTILPDVPDAKEQRPAEQKVVAPVHAPASRGPAGEPPDQPQLAVASGKLGASCYSNSASTDYQPGSPETGRQKAPASASGPADLAEKSSSRKRPEAASLSNEASPPPAAGELGAAASARQLLDGKPDNREAGAMEKALATCRTTEPARAERPEPEGEVAGEVLAVPFAESLQADLVKDDPPLTKDERPSVPAATQEQRAQGGSCQSPSTAAPTLFPLSASAPDMDVPVETQHHENGDLCQSAETTGGMEELHRLAAGLITEVLSAATQEVMTVGSRDLQLGESTEVAGCSTPTLNGQETARQQLQWASRSQADQHAAQLAEDVANGCLPSSAWEKPEDDRHGGPRAAPIRGQLHSTPLLPRVQAVEAVTTTEDSGCSTGQSEDGVSSEDLVLLGTSSPSALPQSKEDLAQISGISRSSEGKADELPDSSVSDLVALEQPTLTTEHVAAVCEAARLNGAGLRNGTSETEADQSGGSDVNSMDSMDSCSTLGVGDGQQSGSQASQSQSSEMIVWEIEVPKHLVGRLIGKQGRYVSFLKQSSGAKIYISTLPYTQEFQICHLEGTQQQVDKALALIGKKFKDLDLTNLYAPPPSLSLPSLPMTSWLLLPNGVTVEVIVVNIVSAGHVFVQQHTHPTYHALRSLDQQMFLCYSQPGTPALPSPAEVGVICAAPAVEGAWWRAQVISFYKDSSEVEIRYVDYGGYDRVKIDTLRQIRSDFVTLPFQGTEVLLDNIAPLPGEDRFSSEANSALEEMTQGVPLLAQVTNYDNNTGLPLVQMWNMVGDELVQLNRTLAERGFAIWVDSF